MPRNYVNNAMNRGLGRVGMAVGSMPVSSGGGSRSSSLGSSSNSSSYAASSVKTYVDNAANRRLGRVGMEHGTMVVSKSSTSTHQGSTDSGTDTTSSQPAPSQEKVYKDNAYNRKLNRVGKPIGSAVHSKSSTAPTDTSTKTYVDNPFNRSLGRVGKPLGSKPVSRKSKTTSGAEKVYKKYKNNPDLDVDFSGLDLDGDEELEACDIALSLVNRLEEVKKWQREAHTTQEPHTSERVLQNFRGTKIDFAEINLMRTIGSGGFGDVHFAKWKETIVAVKKLRVQRVSQRRLKDFSEEIILLCQLDHPHIVKFIGACVVTPNLCIVMEYMQMSLFDALHIKDDTDFSDAEKLKITQHTVLGIQYLHDKKIAHCDLKSQNVLLDFKEDEPLVAKITDFGLSMMKNETETSTSTGGERVCNIGTPRYSSPENLRGELLDLNSMKMADMYSFSLVVFEIVSEEEPFYNLNFLQLRRQVGEQGVIPSIPEHIKLDGTILRLIQQCWDREPKQRPTAKQFSDHILKMSCIYQN